MINLYETKKQNQSYIEELRSYGLDADKMWQAYYLQSFRCNKRFDNNGEPILFKLTFREWTDLWLQPDENLRPFWHRRGNRHGDYVMCRHNDLGHYEIGNVFIQTNSTNVAEAHKGKVGYWRGKKRPVETMSKVWKLRCKRISVDGVIYQSLSEAARHLGLLAPTLSRQAHNPNKPNVFYVDEV